MSKYKTGFSLFIILVVGSFFLQNWINEYPENLIWSDMEGYYTYLPSTIISGKFGREVVRDTTYIRAYPGTEKTYTKYTCGVAILELPFFLVSHSICLYNGEKCTGTQPIYGKGLMMAGAFYLWCGLFILWRLCRKYYSWKTTLLALIGILFGTNLFYYTFFQPAMSHVFSFFLFVSFLWLIDDIFFPKHVHTSLTKYKNWGLIGLVFGLIVLARPTNIIIGILPVYIWWKQENNKVAWLLSHKNYLFLGLILFLLPMIPQLMYWKYISGDWIIWSYGDEGFKYWKEPKLIRVLFDAWNGWILYSPIVILPLYFLWSRRHSNQNYERATIYTFIIATYIFASWWAWWFGGAFGHRSYVEYLALLAIPLCGFIHKYSSNKSSKYAVGILILILCYYSTGLTFLYVPPWDGDSWTYMSVWIEIKKLMFLG